MNYELDCWDYVSTRDSILNILQVDINEFEMLILNLKYLVLIDKVHETSEVILGYLKTKFPKIRIDYVYFYHRTRWHSKNDLMKGLKSNVDFFPEVKKYFQSIFSVSLTPIFDQITFQESSFRYSRILDINNRLAKKSQNGPWFFIQKYSRAIFTVGI
jgi:hypothetical protein